VRNKDWDNSHLVIKAIKETNTFERSLPPKFLEERNREKYCDCQTDDLKLKYGQEIARRKLQTQEKAAFISNILKQVQQKNDEIEATKRLNRPISDIVSAINQSVSGVLQINGNTIPRINLNAIERDFEDKK